MADNKLESGWRNLYTLIPDAPVNVEVVLGSATPMKLALPVRVTKQAQISLSTPPEVSKLEILLDQQTALILYAQMAKAARELDWPLPKEN